MKLPYPSPVLSKLSLLIPVVFGSLFFAAASQGSTVQGGSLILNIDRDALIAGVILDNYPDAPTADFPICCRPSIYMEEFFDYTAVSKTFNEIRTDNTPDLYDLVSDEISSIGLEFPVNGSTIPPNATGRSNRSTTLDFDPNDIANSTTGRVGFGGVIRYRVDVTPPSNRVMLGDFTLEYNPELEDANTGRSAWVLMNNIGFPISGFDLFDVNTSLIGSTFSLSGKLGLGEGFDHLGGIRDTEVGTFSFHTTVVPLPAAFVLFLSGLSSLGAIGLRRNRTFATNP